ncbi:LysR family transcriptional regulator [Moraxella bovis]|uniref:LysR family transcriptional regulator n=1 Tax=Moraxella bovis TaxID=476 RepID=UPI0022268AF3|nr:LysR family transcriptional regulator [Moraxella bovis]UYZ69400.1 LysR family transcriptional regulator [Moraxella bovis]UYZ71771.1 LysR family transcriptional regulator [Moraxella bovis]UYZ72314.1 LysR family transcriptional regulator [Moraxella bovis]UZA15068.1 LysR family transcriptional regulator [Moraxella bovis]UZA26575.1 LysR family transcriptional regulator [Moraxella bovis]
MDTLTSIKVFHQVVLTGSFTKSADSLDMSVAMTSKHVAHLERTLGTKLLHRNSRNIHLTDAGEQYYRESLYALELLDSAKETAQGATDGVRGMLKITMPRWFANPKMAGYLSEFQARYPDVTLNVSLSNQFVDLVADGFDLALRITHDPKLSLIARPLTRMDFYLVASPDYLSRHGTPTTPDELNDPACHRVILPTYVKMDSVSIYHHATQAEFVLNLKPSMYSNDTPMISELVRAGAGIGYAPSWLVEHDLADGRLVQLLADYELLSVTLYAVYVDRAFLSARVRAFIDFMVEKLDG